VTLALVQKGTRAGLVVWCSPMPANADGTEGAPGLSKECRAALGPAPTIVGVNAHGTETLDEILQFAHDKTGIPRFQLSNLSGFSAGCQNVRRWAIAGAPSLSYVLCDGMHCAFPEPTPEQAKYMLALAKGAREGRWTAAISHSYIVTEPAYTSTRASAEFATGWPAPDEPPPGEGQRRDEGSLHVLSVGGHDTPAHIFQAQKVLPKMFADYVRNLVDGAPEIEGPPGAPGVPVVTPGEPLPPEPPPAPAGPSSPSPAALAALRDMDARWPARSKVTDGIMGDERHQADPQNAHVLGNAVDITNDPASGAGGQTVAELALADTRSRRVIWNRQVNSKDPRGWHPYTGSDPHLSHVHVEIVAALREDASPWPWAPDPGGGAPAGRSGAVYTASDGWLDIEAEYLPRVVQQEIGDVHGAAMQFQSIAARTFLLRAMRDDHTLGTPAQPVKNSQGFQAYAATAGANARLIVASTRGQVLTWAGQLIIANYVAGAKWVETPAGAPGPRGRPGPPDALNTERWVTYNAGRSGDAVLPSAISSTTRRDNRGCASQEGAKSLAVMRGADALSIARFYYGEDVQIVALVAPVPGAPNPPAAPVPGAPAGGGDLADAIPAGAGLMLAMQLLPAAMRVAKGTR
jgi:hypothetical protein